MTGSALPYAEHDAEHDAEPLLALGPVTPAANGEIALGSVIPAAKVEHPLVKAAASGPPVGQKIWIHTTNTNTYVNVRTDETNNPLQASAGEVLVWEIFEVVDGDNGFIALKADATGLYVSARINRSNVPLQATASHVRKWERFTWETDSHGTFSLKSAANSKYVSARSDHGNTPLRCNSTSAHGWEQFRWGMVAAASSVPFGEKIWLQATSKNKYVNVRSDKILNQLDACSSRVQAREIFEVVDGGDGLIALRADANGLYLSARIDDIHVPLHATASKVYEWERFSWVTESNGTFSLLSAANDNYVSARSDPDHTVLNCRITTAQGGERFRWGLVTTADTPDFGPNVFIFDPSMSHTTIQDSLNKVFHKQQTNQFGTERYAFLFKPGAYPVDVKLGFYTQVAGLGLLPDAATIKGQVHVEGNWFEGNATQNFWRAAENLQFIPPSGTNVWAGAQAAPLRRVDVQGNLQLDDGGSASGGYMADCKVTGQVRSGSQQQWFSRNDQFGHCSGSDWNMVFVGVRGAPFLTDPSYTVVNPTPVVREKPFLYIDQEDGDYRVFVPGSRMNSSSTSWRSGSPVGTSLPLSEFFIAKAGDTASKINAALSEGLNLLFTPGVYHLSSSINVTRAGTVVLGMGIATLIPNNGIIPMTVADVDGVSVAGLLFDAGSTNSPILLQVGHPGCGRNHASSPTLLSDVFFRIGGSGCGKANQSLVINSNNVIVDHTWIWRADHGCGLCGRSDGMIINGNNVTIYGLFVKHNQQYNVIWNGDNGRTYFFQNELPYQHGVRFRNMVTVSLGGTGVINHVINPTGLAAKGSNMVVDLVNHP